MTSLKVSNQLLANRQNRPANVQFPTYDRSAITEGILHIGVGGFHRSHQALYIDSLLEAHGVEDWA
ncbi:MAG TPA: hypothetical protein V6D17_02925, partial [Candidatus Obscuribacterales bacterium]